METSLTYTGKVVYFSSDEPRWKKRIAKYAEEHPDEVTILRRPEENDGCVYATFPVSYVKIQPKSTRKLTDEQKLTFLETMRKSRAKNTQDTK